jgi:hypothetical protein
VSLRRELTTFGYTLAQRRTMLGPRSRQRQFLISDFFEDCRPVVVIVSKRGVDISERQRIVDDGNVEHADAPALQASLAAADAWRSRAAAPGNKRPRGCRQILMAIEQEGLRRVGDVAAGSRQLSAGELLSGVRLA